MKKFIYNNYDFEVFINEIDLSGDGSINEIVNKNEYILSNFKNKKNKIFIDIGANIGIASLIMAKLNPDSIIYSFEPFKPVYDLFVKNIEHNNIKNIIPFNLAISNKTQDNIELICSPYCSGNGTIYANNLFTNVHLGEPNKSIISTIEFDEFIDKYNINEIYLLKIDCEGAEYDIIYDSKKIKENLIKNIVGEFHDLKYNNVRNGTTELYNYCSKYIDGTKKITFLKI